MRWNIFILCLLAVSCGLISVGLLGCGQNAAGNGPFVWSEHARRTTPPAAVGVEPFDLGKPDLVLLITGRNNGQLEICNCAGEAMPGGLSRRGGLFVSYRRAFPQTLAVDVGDFLPAQPDELRNDALARAYALLAYDALAAGDQEFAVGAEELQRLADDHALPVFSTEVTLKRLDVPASVAKTAAGRRVVFFSAVEEDAFRFLPQPVRPALMWREHTLAESLAAVGEEDFVVVVAHGGDALADRVAVLGRVNLILRAHTSQSDPQIRFANSVPVVKVGGSDFVGALAVKFDPGAGPRVSSRNLELRVEAVDARWPADARVFQVYQAYAHADMRRVLDADKPEGLTYVPSATCGACHTAEFAGWQKSRHARAYKTLTDIRREGDPNCLMCHTSGFGTARGFTTIKQTPRLANVNCQSCHRFNLIAGRHGDNPAPRPDRPDEKVCTSCHTPVTAPNFNFGTMKSNVH